MTCKNPETGSLIGSYELGLLSKEEKGRFEVHLLSCNECFRELYDMAPVAEQLRDGAISPTEDHGPAAENVESIAARRDLRAARPVWQTWAAWAAGIAALVVVGVFAFRTLGPWDEPDHLRGPEPASIVVFAPMGEVAGPTELDWKVVPMADTYELRIHTATGELLWEGTATEPPAPLPQAVRNRLEPDATYFWQVTARSASGEHWESDLTSFKTRD